MGLIDWLFVGRKKGMSLEEGRALQEQIFAALSEDDRDSAVNLAAKLMLAGRFHESIEAYERIAEADPEERATCEAQIGGARFFLCEYEAAITHYLNAIALGEHAEMMDDNVWEACEALAAQSERRSEKLSKLRRYRELFPDGINLRRLAKAERKLKG